MQDSDIVVQIRLFESGKLRAFADVTYPGEITATGFKVMQIDGQGLWVAFPSVSYPKNGKTINKPVLELPRSLRQQTSDRVLAEYKRAVESSASQRPA